MLMTANMIANYMNVSQRQAYNILNRFVANGTAVVAGKIKRVDVRTFAKWLSEMDGMNEKERIEEIKHECVSQKNR